MRLRGVLIFATMSMLFACGDTTPRETADMAKPGVSAEDADVTFLLPDSVSIFFLNSRRVSGTDCRAVYPVRREWCQEDDSDIVDMLLAGPTSDERARGFTTAISKGVVLNRLQIIDSSARVDFSRLSVAGSCSVQAVRAQIERTLVDLSWVRRVIISVDGNVEGALQP